MSKSYNSSRRRRRHNAALMEKTATELIEKYGTFEYDGVIYTVPSSSESNKRYMVTLEHQIWYCNCEYRKHHTKCSHIYAVQMSIVDEILNKKSDGKTPEKYIVKKVELQCLNKSCISKPHELLKSTEYDTKRGKVPMYRCSCCGQRTNGRIAFKNKHYSDETITLAILLNAVGNPYERIAEVLEQKDGKAPSKTTINDWCKEYGALAEEYIKSLPISTSNIWSVDEKYILMYPKGADKNLKFWLFMVRDAETNYILSHKIADCKDGYNTVQLLTEAVELADGAPDLLISDALKSYKTGHAKVMKELGTYHQADAGVNKIHQNNNPHEQLNGEMKDLLGRARGYKTRNPARVSLAIIYHNFIHKTAGTIPSEASNVYIEGHDKFRTLIENAALAAALSAA